MDFYQILQERLVVVDKTIKKILLVVMVARFMRGIKIFEQLQGPPKAIPVKFGEIPPSSLRGDVL